MRGPAKTKRRPKRNGGRGALSVAVVFFTFLKRRPSPTRLRHLPNHTPCSSESSKSEQASDVAMAVQLGRLGRGQQGRGVRGVAMAIVMAVMAIVMAVAMAP